LAATRVYILAKELGVKSTAIVQKCQDEGLDVKNHMSAISAGLAATIREWFSEGEHRTTVEKAEKVDLKKVRVRKKTARKRAPKKVKAEKAKKAKPVEPPAEAEKPAQEPEKREPEPILPAGPILEKPEPARLSGPQVVRVEAPEPIEPPRPRVKVRYDEPITERLMYDEQELEQSFAGSTREKKRGPKQHGERTHGRRRDEGDIETVKRFKLSRWRQRDLR